VATVGNPIPLMVSTRPRGQQTSRETVGSDSRTRVIATRDSKCASLSAPAAWRTPYRSRPSSSFPTTGKRASDCRPKRRALRPGEERCQRLYGVTTRVEKPAPAAELPKALLDVVSCHPRHVSAREWRLVEG
jgi:hypothetical protein